VTSFWQIVVAVVAGLVFLWILLVLILWFEQRRHPDGASLRDMLRLAPDVVRLLKRLASDRTVSVGVRIWLALLLVYLLSPIDLIPDFVPVLGFADDALVVAIALRFAIRHAGRDSVDRHWPGTAEGLTAILRDAPVDSPVRTTLLRSGFSETRIRASAPSAFAQASERLCG